MNGDDGIILLMRCVLSEERCPVVCRILLIMPKCDVPEGGCVGAGMYVFKMYAPIPKRMS